MESRSAISVLAARYLSLSADFGAILGGTLSAMDVAASGAAQPGWYPDPSGTTAWRWWDGYQWTGHLSPPVAQPQFPPGPPPQPLVWTGQAAYVTPGIPVGPGPYAPTWPVAPRTRTVHERFASETELAPWAKRAFVGMLAVTVLVAVTAWPQGAWLRSIVAQVQTQVNADVTNVTVSRPAGLTAVSSVVLLLEIAIFVVLLNWQHSAAKTAQMLHLPATHSPGLGVGSWFIPVVGLWFPYQALRDCLPAGNPDRGVVGRMWFCYLGAVVAAGVALGLSYARTPVAIAVAEVAVAFAIGVAFNGTRLVGAMGDAHRELIELSGHEAEQIVSPA